VTHRHEITQLLDAAAEGDQHATEQLLPLVYQELRKLAATKMIGERPDHTLQATALVNEAYLRLFDAQQVRRWESRGHFFSAAAEAMRRILIDRARSKGSLKRGGKRRRFELLDQVVTLDAAPDLMLDLDAALTQLAGHSPDAARLFRLRYFGGLSVEEAAAMMELARTSAYELFNFARAWLANALSDHREQEGD